MVRRPRRNQPVVQNTDDLRINRQIRMRDVFLIDDEGNPIGSIPTLEAQRRADEAGLDLVEINPNQRPPVCKIMDYGKYKYKKSKKSSQPKAHQAKVKEVRLHPRTEEHDVQVRIKQAKKFLEGGDKVLVNCWFKGREVAFKDFGYRLMDRFRDEFAMLAKIEKTASMEGKKMTMLLAPLTVEQKKKLEKEADEKAREAQQEALENRKRRVITLDEARKIGSEAVSDDAERADSETSPSEA